MRDNPFPSGCQAFECLFVIRQGLDALHAEPPDLGAERVGGRWLVLDGLDHNVLLRCGAVAMQGQRTAAD